MNAPAKRSRFEPDPHGWYAEPAWVNDALFRDEPFLAPILDPACGFGRIVEAAERAGYEAAGSDVEPRWLAGPEWASTDAMRGTYRRADFLNPKEWPPFDPSQPLGLPYQHPGAIVSNPPFHQARAFVSRALAMAPKVAIIMPTVWINGAGTQRWLEGQPLYVVRPIAPRPSMLPGTQLLAGRRAGGGTKDYAWLIFLRGYRGQPSVRFLRQEP
jgi:SAM-dependent methyltransferase